MIEREAQACLSDTQGINFENKIVLSIAIRLAAEKFMINQINNSTLVANITANQTGTLYTEYKRVSSNQATELKLIERVLLMTPQNIHLNAFMYEPIVDMSDEHLRLLYQDIQAMNSTYGVV